MATTSHAPKDRDVPKDKGKPAPSQPSNEEASPFAPSAASLLALQRQAGNRAVTHLIESGRPDGPATTSPTVEPVATPLPLAPDVDRSADDRYSEIQRRATTGSSSGVQRAEPTTMGTVPTVKLEFQLPKSKWTSFKLADNTKDPGPPLHYEVGIEPPTITGEVKPPQHLAGTDEVTLKRTAKGKLNFAVSREWLIGEVGPVEIVGKEGLEFEDGKFSVPLLEFKFPESHWGGYTLNQQVELGLLEWEKDNLPKVAPVDYKAKVSSPKLKLPLRDGWEFSGMVGVTLKVSLSLNPVWVAQRLAAVAGSTAAAVGGGILGGVAVAALSMKMVDEAWKAGRDQAIAIDHAKMNSLGYLSAYVGTALGHPQESFVYANTEGSRMGSNRALRILDSEVGKYPGGEVGWNDALPGVKAIIRKKIEEERTLEVPKAMETIWQRFRAEAIARYRREHKIKAWLYDRGWGGNEIGNLITYIDRNGPHSWTSEMGKVHF